MSVTWTGRALHDLESIRSYVAKDDPVAARRLVERLIEISRILVDHPHLGRPGRVAGTRELIVSGTPYLIPYRVRDREVSILRVYHGSRRWPRRL